MPVEDRRALACREHLAGAGGGEQKVLVQEGSHGVLLSGVSACNLFFAAQKTAPNSEWGGEG
jgi:hypothetical protein